MALTEIDASSVTATTPLQQTTAEEGMKSIYENLSEVKNNLQIEQTENQSVYLQDQIQEFRSALKNVGDSARKSYSKALISLESFMRAYTLQYESLSTRLLADWLITLYLDGHTLSTLTLYLNAISSLNATQYIVKSASSTKANDETAPNYTLLRATLKSISNDSSSKKSSSRQRVTASPSSVTETIPSSLLRDLYKTAVIAGGISIESAARLRKSNLPDFPEEIAELTAPYIDSRRRYLFPLDQSNYTPRQLAHRLAEAYANASSQQLRTLPTPAESWFRKALQLGATPSEAIAALGRNPLLGTPQAPIIRLLDCVSKSTTEDAWNTEMQEKYGIDAQESAQRLRALVAEAVTDNPLHWYAMHLRQGVTLQELQERLDQIFALPLENTKTLSAQSPRPGSSASTVETPRSKLITEIFYPTHKVAERTPKGIRHHEEPLLPGILFFRARLTDLLPLFRQIGDIAWCYRDPSRRDRGYAPIPDRQMQAFQLAIGIFTEETTVAPLGTIMPRPGQKILILGGPLAGHTATFQKTKEIPPSSQVLYRLTLPGINGIEWQADLDPRILELLQP